MVNHIIGFIRLQQIDTRLDQVRARLHQIKLILEDDQEVRKISSQIISEENQLSFLKSELLSAEIAVKNQQVKIQQTEANLYSGKIINPKELQDLQSEIGSLKRQLNFLENKLLDVMISNEETQNEYDQICSRFNTIKKENEKTNSTILLEQNNLNKEIEKLNSEKKAAEISLTNQDISLYNKLRLQRGGYALSSISEGACSSCGATLTPAQHQAVKAFDQMIFCPSCGRILYST